MHLIKATVIKALLTGAAATATVSTGVVLTVAAVEFSTGNYADASKEIEAEEEDLTLSAETYVPIIASQEGNDDANSYLIDTTDNDYEFDDTSVTHNNMTAANNTGISSPVKTADTSKTDDSSLASVIGSTVNGSALADNTTNIAVNTDNNLGSTVDNTANSTVNTSDGSVNTAADTNNSPVNSAADTGNSSVNSATDNSNSSVNSATDNSAVNTTTDNGNSSVNTTTDNSSVNTAVSVDNSAPSVADVDNSPVYTAANSDNGNDTASSSDTSLPDFYHSTSIYDEGVLLRVEYYVEGDNLPAEYSDVTDYDKDTNSYTETVYRYDDENDVEVVVRTDTYVNGELVSSETP